MRPSAALAGGRAINIAVALRAPSVGCALRSIFWLLLQRSRLVNHPPHHHHRYFNHGINSKLSLGLQSGQNSEYEQRSKKSTRSLKTDVNGADVASDGRAFHVLASDNRPSAVVKRNDGMVYSIVYCPEPLSTRYISDTIEIRRVDDR